MNLTKHAAYRVGERCISQAAIDLVLDWGVIEHHRGAEIYRLNKKGMKQVRRYLGPLFEGPLVQIKNIYVVVKNGVIITVARQNCHAKRERR